MYNINACIFCEYIRFTLDSRLFKNSLFMKGDSRNGTLGNKMVAMIGGGNASLCEDLLKYYLAPADADMCSPKPCSIGQVYQPSVKNRRFFTFGLIYYLAKDFGILSEPGLLDLKEMQRTVRDYCEQVNFTI